MQERGGEVAERDLCEESGLLLGFAVVLDLDVEGLERGKKLVGGDLGGVVGLGRRPFVIDTEVIVREEF